MDLKNIQKVLFLAAMKEELESILNSFKNYEIIIENHFTINFHIIKTKKIILICALCGCGKVNSSMTTTISIITYQPDFIVNIGVAGGFHISQKPLDLVIGTSFIYTDVDIECLGFKPGQLLGEPQIFPSNLELINLIKELDIKNKLNTNVHFGQIGTSDSFISQKSQILKIKNLFPDVICVEMEGTSISHVCSKFNCPILAIRSLSDIAISEEDNSIQFNDLLEIASKRAALISNLLINKLNSY